MNLEEILDRPIAFHRAFVYVTGSVASALMLSQAMYWSRRTRDAEGWFYKTVEEWEEETGLKKYEQEGARKKLKETVFWMERRRGIPCRLFFRIEIAALSKALKESVAVENKSWLKAKTGDGLNPQLEMAKSPDIRDPEITTETTSRRRSEFALPEWMPREAWDGFEEMRRKGRHPLTDRARMLTIRALEKLKKQGQDPVACLDQTTQRGWSGVFALKEDYVPAVAERVTRIRKPGEMTEAERKLYAQYEAGKGSRLNQ